MFAVENSAGPAPNSDFTYQQLRNLGLSGEAVSVNNLTLKRDAATFHLHSGTVCFVAPAQGKVTGAVFVGDGGMILDPPLGIERASLKLLTKEDEFSERFSQLVLRFTDTTYDEIKKAGTTAWGGCDAGLLRESQNAMRHDRMLKYNLDARILQDVLSTVPGGLFLAFVHGKRYNDREIFVIDPHGAPPLILPVDPEEVELITYDENKLGVWASFHFSSEYKNGTASGSQQNGVIHIQRQQLNTTIEKSANLTGKATTEFVAVADGVRVVPFNLHRTLRVQSVRGADSQPLSFIQEDKNDDADFYVILPKTLSHGEKYSITTNYGGKEAVINEGSGNYYPIARENWYPNNATGSLGEYTSYDLTFRIPKGLKMAATGSLVSENTDGNQEVTVWKSDVAQPVAGFQFGKMKEEEVKMPPDFLVSVYANEEAPHLGALSTRRHDGQPEYGARHEAAAAGGSVCHRTLHQLFRTIGFQAAGHDAADRLQLRAVLAWSGCRSAPFTTSQCVINWGWIGATAATGKLWPRTRWPTNGGGKLWDSTPIATSG